MAIAWRKQVIFDKQAVQIYNPISEVIQSIIRLLPANIVETELSIMITELYNNAVDHGLLELSSEIKYQEGLEAFYNLRKTRLEDFLDGSVGFVFNYKPLSRILTIEANDTGKGFDFDQQISKPLMTDKPSGRGLYIIKNLAQDLSYDKSSNTIKIEYRVRTKELSNRIETGLKYVFKSS